MRDLNDMNDHSDIPVLVALRQDLIDGVRRSNERRTPAPADHHVWRWPAAVGAVAALAALVFVALVLAPIGSSGPKPAAAFTVEVEADGRIHVTMHPDFRRAQELGEELREAGVDVRVESITAHPMLVGQVELPSDTSGPGRVSGLERGRGEFWIDPDRFEGEVEMLVYVAAEPGEEWNQAPSVFHPDEPLGGLPCALDGQPLTTDELQARARSVGIDEFTWWILTPIEPGDISAGYMGQSADIGPTDPAPAGEVEEAHLVGPHHLSVSVFAPDVAAELGPIPPPSMNLNIGGEPEPQCTPELRDRWLPQQ